MLDISQRKKIKKIHEEKTMKHSKFYNPIETRNVVVIPTLENDLDLEVTLTKIKALRLLTNT